MPAEGGAFDAGGEGVDASEGGKVVDLVGCLAGCDDLLERVEESLGFGGGFAFHLGGHERGAGLGNCAAGAFKTDLGDAVVIESQVNGAVVAAGRVVAAGHVVGDGQLAAVARTLVVVENDRLVEIGEIGLAGNDYLVPLIGDWQTRSANAFGVRDDKFAGVLAKANK